MKIDPSEPLPVGRSPVRWYGGKGKMVGKLMPLIPSGGRPYTECYSGGASLFWSREPAPVEVLNDLSKDLINLFRCLQNRDAFDDLKHRLTWTLYSRAEFERALEIEASDEQDPVTRAWAFFVAKNQGFAGESKTPGQWGRAFVSCGGMVETTNKWLMRIALLDAWRLRIQRVQIECRDALDALRYWDAPDAVHYLDPPYPHGTRSKGSKQNYQHEADEDHHAKLIEVLLGLKGAAVVSGYDSPIYRPLDDAGWERIEFQTACYAAGRVRGSGIQGEGAATAKVPRTEVVWRNPKAAITR